MKLPIGLGLAPLYVCSGEAPERVGQARVVALQVGSTAGGVPDRWGCNAAGGGVYFTHNPRTQRLVNYLGTV